MPCRPPTAGRPGLHGRELLQTQPGVWEPMTLNNNKTSRWDFLRPGYSESQHHKNPSKVDAELLRRGWEWCMETSQVSDEAKESMVKDLEEASQTDNPVTEVLRPLSRFTAAVPQGTPASSSGGVLPVPEKAAQGPLLGNTDEVLSGVREGSVALGEPSPSVLTSTGRPGDVVGSVTDVSKPAVELPAITTHGVSDHEEAH